MSEQYLTANDVVARYGGQITRGTLANWRSGGVSNGPPFTRIGNRILYPLSKLEAWEKSQTIEPGKKPDETETKSA